MLNFCTLFDSNFLVYGLAMYESLKQVGTKFHLYVVAFDNAAYEHLIDLKLGDLTVISLTEFENPQLLSVKPTRSVAEYCWTCTPSVIDYCIKNYSLDHCIYVDADLKFFADPIVLFNEAVEKGKSIMITDHNYIEKYDQSRTSGRFCVQFMLFRNDEHGMEALEWWRDACIEWCFARYEDGKFGDQKYLDDWEDRFKGVWICKHIGAGIAPWNVSGYDLLQLEDGLYVRQKKTGVTAPVIFYHYHGLRLYKDRIVLSKGYELSKEAIIYVYKPYLARLNSFIRVLKERRIAVNLPSNAQPVRSWLMISVLFATDMLRKGHTFVKRIFGENKDAKLFRFNFKEYHIYNLKNGEIN